MSVYTAVVTREDNLWVADIHGDDLGPAAMDYEHLSELHDDVPSYVADLLRTTTDTVKVVFRYEVNGRNVTEQMERLMQAERQLRELQSQFENARMDVVNALIDAGLSQRTTADAVGLSHQRVNQLVKAPG